MGKNAWAGLSINICKPNWLFVVFLILNIIIVRDVKDYLQTFNKVDFIDERKKR